MDKNINGKDPVLRDAQRADFRLRKSSPAAGGGKDGVTIGALEYPNVYYVDPRHQAAADEPGWGYSAVPLPRLAKAFGETVVRDGALDLGRKQDIELEGIVVVNLLRAE